MFREAEYVDLDIDYGCVFVVRDTSHVQVLNTKDK